MDAGAHIPDIVIRRLPIYARALGRLLEAGGQTVSSRDIALATGHTAAQVRRDLSYFGEFGKQGKGYDAQYLLAAIKGILNIKEEWKIVLVGAGPLGQAVARYRRFASNGFHISWVYDHNPERIGILLDGLIVEDVREMQSRIIHEDVKIAIIAVPDASAQRVADSLVEAGVKAILNYAPVTIQVPRDVRVYDIDPVAALQSLTYYLPHSPHDPAPRTNSTPNGVEGGRQT